jgi:hypothetical protein
MISPLTRRDSKSGFGVVAGVNVAAEGAALSADFAAGHVAQRNTAQIDKTIGFNVVLYHNGTRFQPVRAAQIITFAIYV